ncbi:MAG: DUF5946 family protein [Terracidiphilus sp.]|jgi:hypothetical protein
MALKAKSEQELNHELSYYTLAHSDPSFIHQHAVDAFAAQNTDESSKPISVVFALVGLYLHVEKNFTGRQVQEAHMRLAKRRRQWIRPALPEFRGAIRIRDVLAAEPGTARDAMIHAWCADVWRAWQASKTPIVALVKDELGIE